MKSSSVLYGDRFMEIDYIPMRCGQHPHANEFTSLMVIPQSLMKQDMPIRRSLTTTATLKQKPHVIYSHPSTKHGQLWRGLTWHGMEVRGQLLCCYTVGHLHGTEMVCEKSGELNTCGSTCTCNFILWYIRNGAKVGQKRVHACN